MRRIALLIATFVAVAVLSVGGFLLTGSNLFAGDSASPTTSTSSETAKPAGEVNDQTGKPGENK